MSSGLYALPGASAAATAAAWANRLDEPMTKVSKTYFGLSRVSSDAAGGPGRRARGRWQATNGSSRSVGKGIRRLVDLVDSSTCRQPAGASRLGRLPRPAARELRVDGDGEPHGIPNSLASASSSQVRSRPSIRARVKSSRRRRSPCSRAARAGLLGLSQTRWLGGRSSRSLRQTRASSGRRRSRRRLTALAAGLVASARPRALPSRSPAPSARPAAALRSTLVVPAVPGTARGVIHTFIHRLCIAGPVW